MIDIEIAYAPTAELQIIIPLQVPADSNIEEALIAANIVQRFPELDLKKIKVGIFGRLCQLDEKLTQGDRIEIYRPLLIDPKQARRLRRR